MALGVIFGAVLTDGVGVGGLVTGGVVGGVIGVSAFAVYTPLPPIRNSEI